MINGEFIDQYEAKSEIVPDEDGFYNIKKNMFIEAIFGKVIIPNNMVAFAFPRSTFNRLGVVKSETAVFDSGFEGTATQCFYFPNLPAKIHKDEAWIQLVYFKVEGEVKKGYDGMYQKRILE